MPSKERGQSGLGASGSSRSVMRSLLVAAGFSAFLATVFTAWTPASLSSGDLGRRLASVLEQRKKPTSEADQEGAMGLEGLRIGVVVGHAGLHPDSDLQDPGATCADGLTELQVNSDIASRVVKGLEAAGFQVDLLEEWDKRLAGYRAVALVSIHADSCAPINEQATGYKVAAALDTVIPDRSQRLVACLGDRYGRITGLPFHPESITRDMTAYHSFNEIHSQTPAAIIEVGFLYLDRSFLTKQPHKAAQGIVDGVLCYVNNEPASLPGEMTP